jgi:hypothetical protein
MSNLLPKLLFEFRWRQIADCGMQTPAVIDIIKNAPDPASDVGQVFVLVEIDLVIPERFHEALTLGIVVRVSFPAHADSNLMVVEQPRVIGRRILHAAIGMMNEPLWPRGANVDRRP